MDEDLAETDVPTVGERLRAAREEKGYSLEDIAAQTRIPRRHLEAIELGEWDRLPAPTYTTGFAKSYASAVGLDRTEVGEQLRAEMGGRRPVTSPAEVFEPADPARTMPKWLVFGAILAVIVVVLVLGWLNDRSLSSSDDSSGKSSAVVAQAPTQPAAPAPQATPQPAQGPVVLTATEPVWLSIKDGTTKLKEGLMQAGETYQVPATATAPTMTVGKPEALKINVGSATAPAVGPPGKVASKVSLLPTDLMRGPAAQAGAATSPAG